MIDFIKENFDGDWSKGVSYIIYIANLSEESIPYKDVDLVSKTILNILKQVSNEIFSFYGTILEGMKTDNFINIHNCRIYIRSNSILPIILLNSVRHVNLAKEEITSTKSLQIIVTNIIQHLQVFKWSSTFLLRTLHCILLKYQEILTPPLCWKLLKILNIISLSPLSGFKNYIQSITKIIISSLTFDQSQALYKLDGIPVRGIDTDTLMKLYSRDYIFLYKKDILHVISRMFQNNIDGKVAASLYDRLILFYEFDDWTKEIWPYFSKYVENIDSESEFYQSIIKYWINLNVDKYRHKFYLFCEDQTIDFKLKAHILLECKKRGFILDSDDHLQEIFKNMGTLNIGLRILSTYHKKSICPQVYHIKLFMEFLYTNINDFLDDDLLKSTKMFLSQAFVYAHCDLIVNKERFQFYLNFVNDLYKYCYTCLNTELFEVGCQILHILLDILQGPSSNLSLNYKLDKIDTYNWGENVLYMELVSLNLWAFEKEDMILNIWHCFKRVQGSSKVMTDLIVKHYSTRNIIDVAEIENILNIIETSCTLQNVEKMFNYSRVLYQNELCDDKQDFTLRIYEILLNDLKILSDSYSETILYRSTLNLAILATASNYNMKVELMQVILVESVRIIHYIMKNKFMDNYKPTKVVETFINNVIHSFIRDLNTLWPVIKKEYILTVLIEIIENSNMKRCVTASAEALKSIGVKMEESELDQSLKINLLNETLNKLYGTPLKQTLRIRRNPETRLILHAMCSSEKNPTKPLLKWVLNFLINILNEQNVSDFSVSASLHCLEILVTDNNLHSTTFMYFPEIIKGCVEVFIKPNWIIRNADLQLLKAFIERLYGVSLGVYQRPKNIEHLFMLFPELIKYFYQILSQDQLDERATIVFQFFIESHVKENIFNEDILEVNGYFQYLFVNVIKTYPNHFGKLSALSYVSVCQVENMLEIFDDVTKYLIANFYQIEKNIVANLLFLLSALYEKFQTLLKINIDQNTSLHIDNILYNLVTFLRTTNTRWFDFLLLKVESLDTIITKLESVNFNCSFDNRLWLHNNLPFVITSTQPCFISNALVPCLQPNIPSFMQIKVLSILVSRFKNDEIQNEYLNDILDILFKYSLNVDDRNSFLLSHYFKVILLLVQDHTDLKLNSNIAVTFSNNLYKTMIFIIYRYYQKVDYDSAEFENFCKYSKTQIFKLASVTEELDNDIISVLFYFIQISKKEQRSLYKLIFFYSLFCSTYHSAYSCISKITGKTYCTILAALQDFLIFIKDDELGIFIDHLLKFVYGNDNLQENGFFEVEDDILIPRKMLTRLYPSPCT